MLEWYRAYLYFLLGHNNYCISLNLSPHYILRAAFIGMSWLKHVAIFRGRWDLEVWQDFKEMHIIIIMVILLIIFVITHSTYIGQQSLYYFFTSTTVFFHLMQFVLVLDDGVADVKREDLHIF